MITTTTGVWFVTGASSGLGAALTDLLLRDGASVAATFRSREQADAFSGRHDGRALGIVLDVRDHAAIPAAVAAARERFDRIDVLVNNAGYALLGAVEEAELDEARAQMETNFFGALALLKCVLPEMRERRRGHIVQISSAAGILAAEGMGLYNASKFALEGLSEALAKELRPLGIRVTIVEPGPLRTDFGGRSAVRAAQMITAYAPTAGALIDAVRRHSGTQDGNPMKAAALILRAVADPSSPLRLPLGDFALNEIRTKLRSVESDIAAWGESIRRTSYERPPERPAR